MIVYRSTYKTYLCTLIDYHFNTQILFALKESEKKKINMNFTSYFLISFKHLKKIYIECKYM